MAAGGNDKSLCFSPAHAPSGRFTQQEIDAALIGLTPGEKGILQTESQWVVRSDESGSHRTVIDPNGHLHGVDFQGELFDFETWTATDAPDITIDVRQQNTGRRIIGQDNYSECAIKQSPVGNSNVNISIWTFTKPTEIVEKSQITLRHSPTTAPHFIPYQLVQDALISGSPGREVPLASSCGLLDFGISDGASSEVFEPYNVQFGVDYIGEPDDYLFQ